MYEFHYNYIKTSYPGERSQHLFIDTDSLTCAIKRLNIYDNFYNVKHKFDFSGYDRDSPYFDLENKKVISKMEDDLNGQVVKEFAGLCAKIHSVLCAEVINDQDEDGSREMKKAKVVFVVKKDIKQSDYVRCLQKEKTITIKWYHYDHKTIR